MQKAIDMNIYSHVHMRFVCYPGIDREYRRKDFNWRVTKRNPSSLMSALAGSPIGNEKAGAGGCRGGPRSAELGSCGAAFVPERRFS